MKLCDTCTNTIPEDAENQTICQECIEFEFRYKRNKDKWHKCKSSKGSKPLEEFKKVSQS